MFRRILALIVGLVLVVCACEPEPTPLPVNLEPSPSPLPTEDTSPQGIRYAIASSAVGFLSPDDQNQIAASAEIIILDAPPNPDDLGSRYEIIVILGDFADFAPAHALIPLSLALDTALPPLDDPELADILRRAIDPQRIAAVFNLPGVLAQPSTPTDPLTLRADLANAGYPDGFDLTLHADFTAAVDQITEMLALIGVGVRPSESPAHLTLLNQPSPDAILLLTIPISYRAVEGLTVTFIPSGFPIASR